jgi:hypothetical protein
VGGAAQQRTRRWPQALMMGQTGLRACLAQVNFTSVFLENNFMSDFLDEAELFWKKCLAK